MINNLKKKIEDIIESKNGLIQVVVLFISLVLGVAYKLEFVQELAIIIDLLGVVIVEMIIANVKDSILHRKLNRLGTRIEIEEGKLFRVSDFDLTPMFSKAKKDFFVSGLALNGFVYTYKEQLLGLLRDGKKVRILIMEPEKICDAALLYHGRNDETAVDDIITKQKETLNYIRNDDELKDYLKNGQLKFGLQNIVFSTSFIAYDVFDDKVVKKEVKASFYQYKCTNPESEPNILINSEDSNDWYKFFVKTIREHWKDSRKINNLEELEKLSNELKKNEKLV